MHLVYYVFFSIFQIFWDLASLSTYAQDMMATLDIKQHEVLGKGGYGFVCKGELISAVRNECVQSVYYSISMPDPGVYCRAGNFHLQNSVHLVFTLTFHRHRPVTKIKQHENISQYNFMTSLLVAITETICRHQVAQQCN